MDPERHCVAVSQTRFNLAINPEHIKRYLIVAKQALARNQPGLAPGAAAGIDG